MKKSFKKVALLAALSLAAASCQKENDVLPVAGDDLTSEFIQVVYSINGEFFQTSFSESEWDAFVKRMLALAREGYEVSFAKNVSSFALQGKEIVTFVTDREEEAHAWANNMTNQGYAVTITFNKKTGEYTCIAIK